jgi:thiamine transporter
MFIPPINTRRKKSMEKNQNQKSKKGSFFSTKELTLGAIMLALSIVLSFIKVYQLPAGGSITLLSMLPICIFSIKYGVKKGLIVSFLYSLFEFFQGVSEGFLGWGLTGAMLVVSTLLDYILPFTFIGLAGMFRKKKVTGWILGTTIAIFLRFLSHYFSGIFIWKSVGNIFNMDLDSPWLYSLAYNGSFMLPEMIFTILAIVILFAVPAFRKLIIVND